MTTSENKRPLPAKVEAMKARKRRKLDRKQDNISTGAAKTVESKKRSTSSVDSLSWRSITLPDHLDDYEGLYEIEEVDDVEVVHDPSTGGVSFAAKTTPGGTGSPVEPVESGIDDAEEWSGFDDEADIISTSQSTMKEAKSKAQAPKSRPLPEIVQPNSIFEELDDEDGRDETDVSAWQSMRLSPDTLSSLANLKFSTPTPIQQTAIPEILAGHDVIGKASTGSGKTLAFGIPILEQFIEQRSTNANNKAEKTPIALILSPTRELAHQLDKHLTALCNNNSTFEGLSIATLTGGLSVQKQQRKMKNADIVIGTPGRLWDVISSGQGIGKALQHIQFLVVDEADRLLSEGHFKEVEEIINSLDRTETNDDEEEDHQAEMTRIKQAKSQRQILVFSATFDRNLQRSLSAKGKPTFNLASNKQSLEYLLSKLPFRSHEKPKFLDVNPINQLATGLREGLVQCGGIEKDLYLYALLLHHSKTTKTLVFANSISTVRRLTPFLQNLNLPALGLHSEMAQKARLRAVERFKDTSKSNSNCSILISTDVAARGLDIPNVESVIHYHVPRTADAYVHRSGRTARAGQQGSSILICSPEEAAGVRKLVAKVHVNASSNGDTAKKQGFFIHTLDVDRRLVSKLRQRANLAKKLADVTMAKEKHNKQDDTMRAWAEELGTEYDSDEFEAEFQRNSRGRGSGRRQKEKEEQRMSKAEVGALKAELKASAVPDIEGTLYLW